MVTTRNNEIVRVSLRLQAYVTIVFRALRFLSTEAQPVGVEPINFPCHNLNLGNALIHISITR